MNDKRTTTQNVALKLCVTAMFAAILVGGKEALAALPNVEVVTLFAALAAYVWGIGVAIPAVCAFIAVDIAIWGFNTWVISYVIHWNVIALAFWGLSLLRLKNRYLQAGLAMVLACVLTALFGVLTTVVDTVIGFTGVGFFADFADFGRRFAALYLAGVPFFVTHIVSNTLIFAAAFLPLVVVNRKVKMHMFGEQVQVSGSCSANSSENEEIHLNDTSE